MDKETKQFSPVNLYNVPMGRVLLIVKRMYSTPWMSERRRQERGGVPEVAAEVGIQAVHQGKSSLYEDLFGMPSGAGGNCN